MVGNSFSKHKMPKKGWKTSKLVKKPRWLSNNNQCALNTWWRLLLVYNSHAWGNLANTRCQGSLAQKLLATLSPPFTLLPTSFTFVPAVNLSSKGCTLHLYHLPCCTKGHVSKLHDKNKKLLSFLFPFLSFPFPFLLYQGKEMI
jgi:hypothetical protein